MIVNKNIMYVDSDEALKHLCDCLQGSDWVALDTEFLREKTYYPQLCLLQVATPEVVACVDAITMRDMTPLLDWLYQESVVK
ncbi:MAG: ribonuclease D, partial [Gammaproteobacteria bacterium]|nr:ribonuclease D [Gammaproteobacteria bacterium]